jgi:hypothetical protein
MSVRHQHRYRHVIEQIAADPTKQALPQRRVVIGPGYDHVGAEVGGARQQDVGDRDVAARALFGLRPDLVPPQAADDALEPGPVAIEIGLLRPDMQFLAEALLDGVDPLSLAQYSLRRRGRTYRLPANGPGAPKAVW